MNCEELAEIVESLETNITIRRFPGRNEQAASLLLINGEEAIHLYPTHEGVRLGIPGLKWKSQNLEQDEFLSQLTKWIACPHSDSDSIEQFIKALPGF